MISQLFLLTKQLVIVFRFLIVTVKSTMTDTVVQIAWYCVHRSKNIYCHELYTVTRCVIYY